MIFFLLFPIFIYGSFDKEEFSYSFVATQIVNDSLNNFFFKTFSDQFAFGVNFPFGTGIYYLPNIVSSKIAYLTSSILICLLIQYYFLTRVLSIIKVNKSFFIIIILIFSPINIRYIFYHDWISHLFLYSLSFGIIYYLLKIFYKKNIELSYIKILFISHNHFKFSYRTFISLFSYFSNFFYLILILGIVKVKICSLHLVFTNSSFL